jgi:recombination protein RecT
MTEQQNNKLVAFTEALDAAKDKFIQIAPKGLDYTAEYSFAVQALNNNDYLKNVAMQNPLSLQAAIINVAAIGLSLNPAKKQAYLIPRNVKHGDKWVSKIFLEPSYLGLCDIATLSGSIKWVQAQVVRAADNFVDNGPGSKPTHTYDAFATADKRGDPVGVFCTAKTADGDYLNEIMPLAEVIAIRDRSEAWKRNQSGPWASDFLEMAKKSVIRRAFKTWPKTESLERMALAVNISNENEGFEPILTSPPLGEFTAERKSYFDQMITKSDAVGMFLFRQSVEESVFTNLYHSFEKGKKGQYQGIVDTLLQKGQSSLLDCVAALQGFAEQDDTHGAIELLSDLSDDAIAYLRDQCDPQTVSFIVKLEDSQ